MKHILLPLGFALLVAAQGCSEPARAAQAPKLAELPLEPDVKASGARLMKSPDGLHRLDAGPAAPLAVVAVHGGQSEGYEWIYALHELAEHGARVYFYRYDFRACPDVAAKRLAGALATLSADASIQRLRVIGHSYGGVVTALMASQYRGKPALEVDLIAAPLAGVGSLKERCGYHGPELAQPGRVVVHQWRTQQALDSAFKDLPVDPQRYDIPGSEVVTLPADYRGHRLGHNWSISWVAEQLQLNAQ